MSNKILWTYFTEIAVHISFHSSVFNLSYYLLVSSVLTVIFWWQRDWQWWWGSSWRWCGRVQWLSNLVRHGYHRPPTTPRKHASSLLSLPCKADILCLHHFIPVPASLSISIPSKLLDQQRSRKLSHHKMAVSPILNIIDGVNLFLFMPHKQRNIW